MRMPLRSICFRNFSTVSRQEYLFYRGLQRAEFLLLLNLDRRLLEIRIALQT